MTNYYKLHTMSKKDLVAYLAANGQVCCGFCSHSGNDSNSSCPYQNLDESAQEEVDYAECTTGIRKWLNKEFQAPTALSIPVTAEEGGTADA